MLPRFQSCRFVQLAGRIACHWPERKFPSCSKSGRLRLCSAGRPSFWPVLGPHAPCSSRAFAICSPHAMPDFGSRLPCIVEQTQEFTSREIRMRPFFLPRAFSAEMEMQLTRSQVDDADDIDDFWSERASEPCCWMDQEAGASDASFFQVASCARRGNIYLPDGVCPSTQDATNEFHLGQDTRVYDGISIPSPTATAS